MISEDKTDFWIKNNMNVLLRSKHGVGKTSIITSAFKKHNLKYLYFSGATLDPWVDFVGVPKEFTDENGVTYLDLVRPKPFAYDDVEAIFVDELNRSQSKVRNAIMELLQFKSINGKKFNNLRMIWAAVNPPSDDEDENELTYQTEEFDPAQEDRFHVIYELPYKPYKKYFVDKFGAETADVAVSWWNSLTDKQKNLVSPRRLDLAVDYINMGGDVRDVLNKTVNIKSLVTQLTNGSYSSRFNKILVNIENNVDGATEELATFLQHPNITTELNNLLKKNKATVHKIANQLPKEVFFKLLKDTNGYDDFILENRYSDFKELMDEISKHSAVSNKARQKLDKDIEKERMLKLKDLPDAEKTRISQYQTSAMFCVNTQDRKRLFGEIMAEKNLASNTVSEKYKELVAELICPLLESTQLGTFPTLITSRSKQSMQIIQPYLINICSKSKLDKIKSMLELC